MTDTINQYDPQCLKHGIWEHYWGDGKVCQRTRYHHGELHGVLEWYQPDGILRWKENYHHGKEHGLWEYRPDGIPCYKYYYLAIK